jgi:hypothetical protein
MILWFFSKIEKCCCPRRKRNEDTAPSSNLPWLWIGAVYSNGDVKDITEGVNQYTNYGMRITPKLLQLVLSDNSPVVWKYLDTKTLEEKEFPSEGFLIDEQ